MKFKLSVFVLLSLLIAAACATSPAETPPAVTEPAEAPQQAEPTAISAPPEDYPPPTAVEMPTQIVGYPEPEGGSTEAAPAGGSQATDYPAPDGCQPLAAAPQQHAIFTEDSILLSGTFYPAAICNAPLVMLFHQYGSSSAQWRDLALWLQNRPEELSAQPKGVLAAPANQYGWFPQMPDGLSFNVFSVDFRGHGQSKSSGESFDGPGYILDARAALAFARALPFVNGNRIITIGTSIGADAAAAACLAIENSVVADFQVNQGCVGVMSLSPGNYLGVNYLSMAIRLVETPFNVHVYCVAAEQDTDSSTICASEVPGKFSGTVYPGRGDHGIALFRESLDPDIGDLILEFLLNSVSIQ